MKKSSQAGLNPSQYAPRAFPGAVTLMLLLALLCMRVQAADRFSLPCTVKAFPAVTDVPVRLAIPSGPVTLIPSISSILSLAVDDRGDLWAGTGNGLIHSKGPGKEWALSTTAQGLSFNRITSIIPCGETIWIGAAPQGPSNPQFGGLMAKEEGSLRIFTPRQGLVSNWISDMLPVAHTLYILTPKGLNFLDTASRKFIYRRDGLSASHPVYDGRHVWLEAGTLMPACSEIISYDAETQIMSRKPTISVFGFDRIESMDYADRRIWVTGSVLERTRAKPEPVMRFEGLHVYDCASGSWTEAPLPPGIYDRKLTVKALGHEVWLFSDRGFGVYRDGALTFYRADEHQYPFIPEHAARTAGGSLWMARSPFIMKFDDRGLSLFRFSNSLASNTITAMALAHGSLWAGNTEGSLDRLSPDGIVRASYGTGSGLPGLPVRELFRDTAGALYALYEEPGDRKNPVRELIFRYSPEGNRWEGISSFKGEKLIDCRHDPSRYLPLISKLRLDTPEGKVLFIEDRTCTWLSTYGCGIVRIGR